VPKNVSLAITAAESRVNKGKCQKTADSPSSSQKFGVDSSPRTGSAPKTKLEKMMRKRSGVSLVCSLALFGSAAYAIVLVQVSTL